VIVPFVACGDIGGYDPDKSYPLELENEGEYVFHEPVQPPIHPNYYSYLQRQKDGSANNSSNSTTTDVTHNNTAEK
jgi:tRNA (cytidine32/guanosine34-2'-O)-methyltransferase